MMGMIYLQIGINSEEGYVKKEFKRLELSEIEPCGWLKAQMELQMKGLSGQLFEKWDSVGSYSGWLGGTGESWERAPYYLDGLLPLSYYLKDQEKWEICLKFIHWTLNSQREDGNFGPQNSMEDYWSRFIMLKVLMQYYEIEKKEEVFVFIERYLRYISNSIDEKPVSEWAKARVGEILYCIKWVYEYKPQKWLLKLQKKLRCQALNWTELFNNFPFIYPAAYYYNWEELSKYQNSEILKLMRYHETHVVNVVMGLKYPVLEGCFDEDLRKCSIAVDAVDTLTRYHGVASGTVNGDEHLSGASPSQGSELCAVVEFMFSLETMLEITGEAKLADRLEKIAYNAYPAAITENYMAHQYLQQANQVLISDQKRDWFNNDNTSNLFGLEPNYGCCTANMHQGWPKLVNSLWFKQKNTLISMVFAPGKVHTLISQKEVVIELETKYPFEETLTYHILNADCSFCLKIRIPQWCRQPEITVDSRKSKRVEGSFFIVEGFFGSGDKVAVRFPMEVRLSQWFHKSQAVERGCLLYGLNLEEKWHVEKESMGICDYSVSTADSWNYAINRKNTPLYVKGEKWENPYSKENPSSKIYIKGKLLKQWNMQHNSADVPPVSPVKTTQEEKTIELIPFGATALRISQFPYYE